MIQKINEQISVVIFVVIFVLISVIIATITVINRQEVSILTPLKNRGWENESFYDIIHMSLSIFI